MDDAIAAYLKPPEIQPRHRRADGSRRIKIQIGNAYPMEKQLTAEVKGRDLVAGVPKTVVVNSDEITRGPRRANPRYDRRSRADRPRKRRPPELAADVVDKGIVITGRGALLRNLDVLLREGDGPTRHGER